MCAMWLAASGGCFHCLPNRYSSFKLAASILRRAMLYLTALVLIGLASADPPAPKQCNGAVPQCVADGENCLNIKIDGSPKDVCIKCEPNNVPIDGACKAAADNTNSCVTPDSGAGGVCASCQGESYLYKGGCYTACPQGTPNPETNTCDGVPAPDCNIPNCEACSEDKKTCTTCQPGHLLTPEKNACLGACPAGSYAAGQACTPCDPSCAECSGAGASRCTACPAGKMLRYADEGKLNEGGQCVEGCVEGPECETCGLTIGGTKYCSKCKGSSVPLNGVCTSNAARAQFCTTAADGACTVCAAGYFIQGGGCYETTRQPGEQICALTDNKGKCQTCANGLGPDGAGTCPSCDPTCKTCSAANQENKCTTCATGYYKTALEGVCTSCESDSNGVTGVRNCLNCAPPSTGSGSVLCYLMKGGDSTGGSTNKSGLTTGAIAGISVAVVIVVGGLVGFLCWWFLCRGKA
ncbi:VSP [Giardia lamblia P15]|uniref:VSP n=1 Tax=Giardia intestinalis (strain P15) TaxID=658858 RepID=E1F9M5_GIAIA|nr:VSP [Giardia lamblia P15]